MKKQLGWIIAGIPVALALAFVALRTASGAAMTGSHKAPGVVDGRLAPLNPSPNNLSTYEAGAYPQAAPLRYSGTQAAARERLLAVIRDMPRSTIELVDGNYIHVTFRSRLFRFVDDVEFLFDEAQPIINFRSASRMGYGDLGVNQKRMAEIRERFEQ